MEKNRHATEEHCINNAYTYHTQLLDNPHHFQYHLTKYVKTIIKFVVASSNIRYLSTKQNYGHSRILYCKTSEQQPTGPWGNGHL